MLAEAGLGFYLVSGAAIVLVGISKSGFGGALGFIAVPAMSFFVSPFAALAIILPVLCCMDLYALWQHWGKWSRAVLRVIVPGGLLGVLFGSLSFLFWDSTSIRLFIGVVAVSFCLYQLLGAGRWLAAWRPGPKAGLALAGLSGFTSCVAHAGGPPLYIYLLPLRLDKRSYAASIVVYFFAVNYSKIIPYVYYGLFSARELLLALSFLPLVPLGGWIGLWLHQRVDETWFYRLCYLLLFVLGANLIWSSLPVGWL